MEVLSGVGATEIAPQASLLGKVHRGRRISLVAVSRALGCGTHSLGTQSGVTGVQRPPKLSSGGSYIQPNLRGAGELPGHVGGPPF